MRWFLAYSVPSCLDRMYLKFFASLRFNNFCFDAKQCDAKFKSIFPFFSLFLLFFDGKNDRCWMVLMFWNTFNIEIDCSVMRLSCLDELLNNDILLSLSFA